MSDEPSRIKIYSDMLQHLRHLTNTYGRFVTEDAMDYLNWRGIDIKIRMTRQILHDIRKRVITFPRGHTTLVRTLTPYFDKKHIYSQAERTFRVKWADKMKVPKEGVLYIFWDTSKMLMKRVDAVPLVSHPGRFTFVFVIA